jgi:hypothetical protein
MKEAGGRGSRQVHQYLTFASCSCSLLQGNTLFDLLTEVVNAEPRAVATGYYHSNGRVKLEISDAKIAVNGQYKSSLSGGIPSPPLRVLCRASLMTEAHI